MLRGHGGDADMLGIYKSEHGQARAKGSIIRAIQDPNRRTPPQCQKPAVRHKQKWEVEGRRECPGEGDHRREGGTEWTSARGAGGGGSSEEEMQSARLFEADFVFVLEFKRTSDQRSDYRERGEARAAKQHNVLVKSRSNI